MPVKPRGIRRKRQTRDRHNDKRVYIYVSDDERDILEEAAARAGTAVSGYVANAAITQAEKDLRKK